MSFLFFIIILILLFGFSFVLGIFSIIFNVIRGIFSFGRKSSENPYDQTNQNTTSGTKARKKDKVLFDKSEAVDADFEEVK
jgi:hypothetical protein